MNNRGFTLVELLAVIVILGLIVAMAIPTITTSLDKQESKEIEQRQELILSEVEINIEKNGIKTKIKNKGCCNVESLLTNSIINGNIAKDKKGNYIPGGVKYSGNKLVYDVDCTTVCN